MRGNIVLVGFMGVGKSAVANFLNESRKMSVIDTDSLIEEKEGCSIQEIFREKGEPYFRGLETKLLEELTIRNISNTVISTGGGIVLDPHNVVLMKKLGKVVTLVATPETIYQRVRNCKNRPIIENNINVENISSLLEKRKDSYEKASSIRIETNNRTIEEICEMILYNSDRGCPSPLSFCEGSGIQTPM